MQNNNFVTSLFHFVKDFRSNTRRAALPRSPALVTGTGIFDAPCYAALSAETGQFRVSGDAVLSLDAEVLGRDCTRAEAHLSYTRMLMRARMTHYLRLAGSRQWPWLVNLTSSPAARWSCAAYEQRPGPHTGSIGCPWAAHVQRGACARSRRHTLQRSRLGIGRKQGQGPLTRTGATKGAGVECAPTLSRGRC